MLWINLHNVFPQKNADIFIDYIFSECDKFAFHLPNYKQRGCGSKMKITQSYKDYLEINRDLLCEIHPYIIDNYIGKRYFNMRYPYACDIYVVRLYKGFKKRLRTNNDLYQWQYPLLPEDLCFFKKNNKKCWLRIVAHEKECFLYDVTDEDKEILNSCGIEWIEINE